MPIILQTPKGFVKKVTLAEISTILSQKSKKSVKKLRKRLHNFEKFSRKPFLKVVKHDLGILNKNGALRAQFSNFIAEKPLGGVVNTPPG